MWSMLQKEFLNNYISYIIYNTLFHDLGNVDIDYFLLKRDYLYIKRDYLFINQKFSFWIFASILSEAVNKH